MGKDVGEDTRVAIGISPNHRGVLAIGDQNEVHHDISDGNGDRARNGDFAQEAKRLGELEVLSRVLLVAKSLAQKTGNHGKARRGVADGKGVVTRNLFNKGTHKVRGHNHVQSGEDCGKDDELATRKTSIYASGNEHKREPVEHMARQENGLPLSKAGNQNVNGKRHNHHDANLGAIFRTDVNGSGGHRLRHHGVKCRRNAINGVARDKSGTRRKDKETHCGHHRAAHYLREGLLLKDKSDASNQRKEDSSLAKDLADNEVKNGFHT